MKTKSTRIPASALLAATLFCGQSHAATLSNAFTFSDLTVNPASAWSDGGGTSFEHSATSTDAAAFQSALANVTDFSSGTNFSVTGGFTVTTNAVAGTNGTNQVSTFGITLFGDTSDPSTGIFASLVLTESRPGYLGGQRLGLGTNRPNAGTNYVGNFPESGADESGGTFLTGSNNSLGGLADYTFNIGVTYDTATQVDISFMLSDGTNSNTLVANDVDITSLASNNAFGVTLSERRRSLGGTFSDFTVTQVPEPTSAALALSALGLALFSRRR